MIIVIVEFEVATASLSTTIAALEVDAAATRDMDGCIAFRSLVTNRTAEKLVLVEEWETMESFVAYKASDAFASVMTTLKPVMVGTPISRTFNATLA